MARIRSPTINAQARLRSTWTSTLFSLVIVLVCSSTSLVSGVVTEPVGTTPVSAACSPNPCTNGGTCLPGNTDDSFSCSCRAGYTGTLCDVAPPVMPTSRATAPPQNKNMSMVNFDCSDEYAASLLWTQRAQLRDGYVRHRCAQADIKLSGGTVSRRCDAETGQWSDIDFSECSLSPSQHVFLLLWLTLDTGNQRMVNDRERQIRNDISNHLGLDVNTTSVFVISTIAVSQGDSTSTLITLSVNYFQLSRPSSSLSSSLTESLSVLNSAQTLGGIAVRSDRPYGHQGFYQSSSCSCQATGDLFAGLCVNEIPFAPCSCTSGQCMCFLPYFVGDGVHCTLDDDGDRYPNVALSSCTAETTNQTYCNQDTCPRVYNPDQDLFSCAAPLNFSGCRLENDRQWDITWGNTLFGEMDVQRCPAGNGFATRRCSSSGWMIPNVMQCDTLEFMSVRDTADSIFAEPPGERPLMEKLSETAELASQVLALTTPGRGASLLPVDLNSTNALIDGIVSLLDQTLDTTENVTDIPNQSLLDIFSNILDGENLDGWVTLQEFDTGSQKLLDNAERYALYLAEALDDDDNRRRVWQTDNMVIAFLRRDPDTDADDVKFPESLDDLSNTSYDSIPAEITLPQALFKERRMPRRRSAPISSIIFRNMEAALPDRVNNGSRVASMVLSTQVGQRGAVSQSLKANPVRLTFTFDKVDNSTDYRCAYWNFSEPIGDGGWAFDGIEMTSVTESDDGKMVVSCSSTHLTSFAVLVDVAGSLSNQNTTTELVALQFVSYIGCGISIACLLVAIVFFLIMGRELFTKVHYFIHLNLSISLCLAYIAFVAGIEKAIAYEASCIFVAALLHYLFLSVFCWMLCEGIMLYLMLVLVFSKLSKRWWIFLIIGYGLPIIPLAVTLGLRYYQYGVRDSSGQLLFCWLSTSEGVIWAFVGPMLLVIAANVIFMIIALATVFRTKRRSIKRNKSLKNLDEKDNLNFDLFKTLLVALLVLLPVLGITWVLGIFAVNSNTTVFAWLFTIFNSLQGVFILIFHVLRSDKVLKSSRAKRIRSRASSTFRSLQTRSTSISVAAKSVKKPSPSFITSTYESSTKGMVLSSIAEDGESEIQLQSNSEKTPLNIGTNGTKLENGTNTEHTFD